MSSTRKSTEDVLAGVCMTVMRNVWLSDECEIDRKRNEERTKEREKKRKERWKEDLKLYPGGHRYLYQYMENNYPHLMKR